MLAGNFPHEPRHEVAGQSDPKFVEQFPGARVVDFEMRCSGDTIELVQVVGQHAAVEQAFGQIGRASCRERVSVVV